MSRLQTLSRLRKDGLKTGTFRISAAACANPAATSPRPRRVVACLAEQSDPRDQPEKRMNANCRLSGDQEGTLIVP